MHPLGIVQSWLRRDVSIRRAHDQPVTCEHLRLGMHGETNKSRRVAAAQLATAQDASPSWAAIPDCPWPQWMAMDQSYTDVVIAWRSEHWVVSRSDLYSMFTGTWEGMSTKVTWNAGPVFYSGAAVEQRGTSTVLMHCRQEQTLVAQPTSYG